jgi:hypothetical protein
MFQRCRETNIKLKFSPEAQNHYDELLETWREKKNRQWQDGHDGDEMGKQELLVAICAYDHVIDSFVSALKNQTDNIQINEAIELNTLLSAEVKFSRSEATKSTLLSVSLN